MISEPFELQAPTELSDALRVLTDAPRNAKPLSGGMTLVPMMTLGVVAPKQLVDLKRIPELAGVHFEGNTLRIGATTTHRDVARHELVCRHAPLLAEAAALIGDVQVRNRGTIGGSVAHADPAANYLPALFALQAEIEVARTGGFLRSKPSKQRIPTAEFFKGLMTTALGEGEIISAICVPNATMSATQQGTSFQKFVRVTGNFPLVSAAAVVTRETSGNAFRGRVGVGGATAVPLAIELPVSSGLWSADSIESAIRDAIRDPLSDANAGPAYRSELAAVYGRRAVHEARQALEKA